MVADLVELKGLQIQRGHPEVLLWIFQHRHPRVLVLWCMPESAQQHD
jgi:hypothetical protein